MWSAEIARRVYMDNLLLRIPVIAGACILRYLSILDCTGCWDRRRMRTRSMIGAYSLIGTTIAGTLIYYSLENFSSETIRPRGPPRHVRAATTNPSTKSDPSNKIVNENRRSRSKSRSKSRHDPDASPLFCSPCSVYGCITCRSSGAIIISERAENQRVRLIPIPAPRGAILDRNGKLLVDSRPTYNVVLSNEPL